MVKLDGELVDGVLQGLHLHGQPLLGLILAQLNMWPATYLFETFSPFPIIPVGPVLKTGLSQLERVLLVMDGVLHGSDVALLLLDLLPGRLHLVLQLLLCPLHLVVALPEVEVGGILLDPQVVAGLLDGVEDGLPQPLTLSHRLLSHHLVVLREGVPSLRNDASLKKFVFSSAGVLAPVRQ